MMLVVCVSWLSICPDDLDAGGVGACGVSVTGSDVGTGQADGDFCFWLCWWCGW